jgi:hypothetical protein
MIYRPMENGWFVITQPAHAVVSGVLASEWGNDQFVSPMPRGPIVLATSLHDIGWSAWDANPLLHADGRPINFLETSLEDTHVVWERGVQQVALFNTYSALLVGMHANLVYMRRRERGVDSPDKYSEVDERLADLASFQAQSLERLRRYPQYDQAIVPTRVQANYRILRACDLLSLAICTKKLAAGNIEDVPGANSEARVTISFTPKETRTLVLKPYLFPDRRYWSRWRGESFHSARFQMKRFFMKPYKRHAGKVKNSVCSRLAVRRCDDFFFS